MEICIIGGRYTGKTTLSIALALYYSKKEKTLLLVDLDPTNRGKSIEELLTGRKSRHGILTGSTKVRKLNQNIVLLPSGRTSLQVLFRLKPGQLIKKLQKIAKHFDITIIDVFPSIETPIAYYLRKKSFITIKCMFEWSEQQQEDTITVLTFSMSNHIGKLYVKYDKKLRAKPTLERIEKVYGKTVEQLAQKIERLIALRQSIGL